MTTKLEYIALVVGPLVEELFLWLPLLYQMGQEFFDI